MFGAIGKAFKAAGEATFNALVEAGEAIDQGFSKATKETKQGLASAIDPNNVEKFLKNVYEDSYALFETGRRRSIAPSFTNSRAAKNKLEKEMLAVAERNRLIALNAYRAKTLTQRRSIVNSGKLVAADISIQHFESGLFPELGGSINATGEGIFFKPPSINKRDRKAVMTILDGEGKGSLFTQEFILTRIQRESTERYQILATFGGFDLILYGSNPVICTCSGFIFDGENVDANWYNRFIEMYHSDIKGSVAAEKGNQVSLFYGSRMIEGVVLKLVVTQDSVPGHLVEFMWVMLVLSDSEFSQKLPLLDSPISRNEGSQLALALPKVPTISNIG